MEYHLPATLFEGATTAGDLEQLRSAACYPLPALTHLYEQQQSQPCDGINSVKPEGTRLSATKTSLASSTPPLAKTATKRLNNKHTHLKQPSRKDPTPRGDRASEAAVEAPTMESRNEVSSAHASYNSFSLPGR